MFNLCILFASSDYYIDEMYVCRYVDYLLFVFIVQRCIRTNKVFGYSNRMRCVLIDSPKTYVLAVFRFADPADPADAAVDVTCPMFCL